MWPQVSRPSLPQLPRVFSGSGGVETPSFLSRFHQSAKVAIVSKPTPPPATGVLDRIHMHLSTSHINTPAMHNVVHYIKGLPARMPAVDIPTIQMPDFSAIRQSATNALVRFQQQTQSYQQMAIAILFVLAATILVTFVLRHLCSSLLRDARFFRQHRVFPFNTWPLNIGVARAPSSDDTEQEILRYAEQQILQEEQVLSRQHRNPATNHQRNLRSRTIENTKPSPAPMGRLTAGAAFMVTTPQTARNRGIMAQGEHQYLSPDELSTAFNQMRRKNETDIKNQEAFDQWFARKSSRLPTQTAHNQAKTTKDHHSSSAAAAGSAGLPSPALTVSEEPASRRASRYRDTATRRQEPRPRSDSLPSEADSGIYSSPGSSEADSMDLDDDSWTANNGNDTVLTEDSELTFPDENPSLILRGPDGKAYCRADEEAQHEPSNIAESIAEAVNSTESTPASKAGKGNGTKTSALQRKTPASKQQREAGIATTRSPSTSLNSRRSSRIAHQVPASNATDDESSATIPSHQPGGTATTRAPSRNGSAKTKAPRNSTSRAQNLPRRRTADDNDGNTNVDYSTQVPSSTPTGIARKRSLGTQALRGYQDKPYEVPAARRQTKTPATVRIREPSSVQTSPTSAKARAGVSRARAASIKTKQPATPKPSTMPLTPDSIPATGQKKRSRNDIEAPAQDPSPSDRKKVRTLRSGKVIGLQT